MIGRYREPVEGTPFGRYQLIELLGRGGMGEVWRAHDTAIDRVVALKMLLPHLRQDPDFDKRFRREARTAARLDDPHVVPIYDVGEIDGRLYVTMRLINGVDLDTLLKTGPLDARTRGAHHRADRVGTAHRPSSRAGAPRRQTVQHSVGRQRLRLPHRLRHRPRRGRHGVDVRRVDHRHLGLHGPRTLQRRRHRTQLRHLRAGLRALPMPHRRAALPRRLPSSRSRWATWSLPPPRPSEDKRHRSDGIGPGDRNGSGQTIHRPIPHRRRNGRRRTTRHHRTDQPTPRRSNTTGPGEPQQPELPASPHPVQAPPGHARVRHVTVCARAVQRTQSAACHRRRPSRSARGDAAVSWSAPWCSS